MKKILLFICLTIISNACEITTDKIYYVGDVINNNIYSHCINMKHKNFKSKYYMSKGTKTNLSDLERVESTTIYLKNNIQINFKNKVVEKNNRKIKTIDKNGKVKVYNIKELMDEK